MRIALVYPRLHRITGAQRLVLKLATYLCRASHHVTLATFYLGSACRAILPEEVQVRQVGPPGVWRGGHFREAALEYALSPFLVRGLSMHHDAVVFFGSASLGALLAFRVLGYRGKTAYFCYEPPRALHTDRQAIALRLGVWGPLFTLAVRPLAGLDRLAVKRIRLLLTNSYYNKAKLRALYGREARVITHGVDLPSPTPEAITRLRARLGIEPDTPVVLTVNHLHPRKRIDLYLRVLEAVKALYPKIAGVVVGDGIERDGLISLASGLGLSDNVRFVGWVPEEDLPSYYGMATVYLHTAREESFGLSVIEAMAAAVPVVAVAEGGPTETVIEGITGFLAPPSREELAQKVAYLLSDRGRAAAIGSQAQGVVRDRYSWDKGAADLVGALQEGCS